METRAQRANRIADIFLPAAAVGILCLVFWYIFVFSATPAGCQAFNLEPVDHGQTMQDPPQAFKIFQVPDKKYAVLSRDGFFALGEPGTKFLDGQGLFICNDESSAINVAAALNADLAKKEREQTP